MACPCWSEVEDAINSRGRVRWSMSFEMTDGGVVACGLEINGGWKPIVFTAAGGEMSYRSWYDSNLCVVNVWDVVGMLAALSTNDRGFIRDNVEDSYDTMHPCSPSEDRAVCCASARWVHDCLWKTKPAPPPAPPGRTASVRVLRPGGCFALDIGAEICVQFDFEHVFYPLVLTASSSREDSVLVGFALKKRDPAFVPHLEFMPNKVNKWNVVAAIKALADNDTEYIEANMEAVWPCRDIEARAQRTAFTHVLAVIERNFDRLCLVPVKKS